MKINFKLLILSLILSLCVGIITQAQSDTRKFSSYFKPEKKYLVLPVKNGAQKRNAQIWVDGVLTRYFDIEDGLVYMPINYNLPAANRSMGLSVKGGTAKVSYLDVYEMKSTFQ